MSSKQAQFRLIWDNWNKEHIKKHGVSISEVEEVCKNAVAVKQSYLGRTMVFGKTVNGRLLTIVLSFGNEKDAYVVSARDMSKNEREIYYEKTKTD